MIPEFCGKNNALAPPPPQPEYLLPLLPPYPPPKLDWAIKVTPAGA
jgi:hypothetical protein